MSKVTATMKALIQSHDGYERDRTGPVLKPFKSLVELADVPVPKPGRI